MLNTLQPALTGFIDRTASKVPSSEVQLHYRADLGLTHLDRIPMGRLGQPHEAAALVEYIVSPEATYTTGVVFDLSGGRATY